MVYGAPSLMMAMIQEKLVWSVDSLDILIWVSKHVYYATCKPGLNFMSLQGTKSILCICTRITIDVNIFFLSLRTDHNFMVYFLS